MTNLIIGEIINAKITEVSSHGVYIQYFDRRGFIQIPEVSWDYYGLQNRVPEICQIGNIIKVKVLSKTDQQFYASIKETQPELNPWSEKNVLTVGQKTQGEIMLLAEYGYLVKLPNFSIAILPVRASETRKLGKGDLVNVEVSFIDPLKQKISVDIDE